MDLCKAACTCGRKDLWRITPKKDLWSIRGPWSYSLCSRNRQCKKSINYLKKLHVFLKILVVQLLVLVLHFFIVPDDRYQATTFKIMAVLSDVYSSKENVTKNPSCKFFIVPRLLVPLICQSFSRPFLIKVLRVLLSFEICGGYRSFLLIVYGSSDEHSWKASSS